MCETSSPEMGRKTSSERPLNFHCRATMVFFSKTHRQVRIRSTADALPALNKGLSACIHELHACMRSLRFLPPIALGKGSVCVGACHICTLGTCVPCPRTTCSKDHQPYQWFWSYKSPCSAEGGPYITCKLSVRRCIGTLAAP
jgi:hypothetical protein